MKDWTETTVCSGNKVINNRIYNVLNVIDDGGGIYTLSKSTDMLIEGNYVHDITSGSLHYGIYLDNTSLHYTVRKNVLHSNGNRNFLFTTGYATVDENYLDNTNSILYVAFKTPSGVYTCDNRNIDGNVYLITQS